MNAQSRAGRRSWRPIAALLTASACCAVVAAATAPAARAASAKTSGTLFVQTATHGSLTRAKKGRHRFVLRLRDVSPQVIWFTDRPTRQTGQLSIGAFTGAWRGLGFVTDPPNAVLTLLHGDDNADTVAMELRRPRYDRKHRTLTYTARPLRHATGHLANFDSDTDRRVPRRFQDASLFIDDASTLEPFNFSYRNVAGVNWSDANLIGALGVGANLANANLTGTNLTGANLTGALMTNAILTNANLANANLTGTNLSFVKLTGTNVTGANLTNANLTFVNLTGANLTGANLTGATLTNAWLSDANLTGAVFCHTTMPNGTVNNQGCPSPS